VTWGAVKGAPEQGAFILTLDSSPRHLQSNWERSATQFSWASFLSGFGFQFVWARLPRCFRTVCLYQFPFVHRSTSWSALRTLAFLKVLLATTTLTRLLSALSRSPMGPGARWGSISNQAPSQRDGAWLVGRCHLISDLQGSGDYPQSPEQGSGCRCCKPFR